MTRRILLPLAAILCGLTAVALIATAHELDPAPMPTRVAVLPETVIVYRDVPVTVTPSPRPTKAPTQTRAPFNPSPIPTPTPSWHQERQTEARSETR